MKKFPEKDRKAVNDGKPDLKTHFNESHNQISSNKLLIRLVKLLARRAAEADFKAISPHHLDQGGKRL